MTVKVKTPASSANLGPGFDTLALALGLYDIIKISDGDDGVSLSVSGEGQGKLDREPEKNLARRSVIFLYDHIGLKTPPIHIHMDNSIPLSRGLGSSAAAIVGTLVGANAFSGADLSRAELFGLAVAIEGHADNVAAALYGGLVIAYKCHQASGMKKCRPAPNVGSVLLVPETVLSTSKARAVLPEKLGRDEAVFNLGRTALLVEALTTGDLEHLPAAVEDALHQPHRRGLISDYSDTEKACYNAGAKGVALSGAGPTLISFYDKRDEDDFKKTLAAEIARANIDRRAMFLDIDTDGAQIT